MTMISAKHLLPAMVSAVFFAAACGDARRDGVPSGPGSTSDEVADDRAPGIDGRAAQIAEVQRNAPSEYAVRGTAAENPAHRFSTSFELDGVEVRLARAMPSAAVRFEVTGFGAPDSLKPAPPVASRRVDGNRVVYERYAGGSLAVREWYLNGPLGLEQGFDIPQPPAGASKAPTLVLAVEVSGLFPQAGREGSVAHLIDEQGTPALQYGELYAFDATGRALPVELEAAGAILSLTVTVEDAIFPVVVDPLIWPQPQTPLQPSDIGAGHLVGLSVNVNGTRAAVGAPMGNSGSAINGAGAAYVFDLNPTTQQWSQTAKLASSTPGFEDNFGWSVATESSYVAVGAPQEEVNFSNEGFTYIFERDAAGTWSEAQKLTPSTPGVNSRFGHSIGMSSGRLIATAYRHVEGGVPDAGVAYIFERQSNGTWTEAQKLVASDADANDRFGINARISGDRTIVGAFFDDERGQDAGAAYIFERQGDGSWVQRQKLLPSDGDTGDWFGVTVSIDGDYAVVGSRNDDIGFLDSGSAYVFKRDPTGVWSETEKLIPSDPGDAAWFGTNVAVSGDRTIVSAMQHDGAGVNAGAIYFFERLTDESWQQEQLVFANPSQESSQFGNAVSLSGTWALVGGPQYGLAGPNAGAAFVFEGVTPIALGGACTESQRCGSGRCVDGVCCDTDCAAACQSCLASQTGATDGTCAPVTGLTDPDGACSNGYCDAGQCLARKADGESCGATAECASRNCIDGVCCDGACGGQCEACDVAGSIGVCTAVQGAPHGSRAACIDNGDACAGTCNGANRSACAYAGGSTTCGEPGCTDGAAQTSSCDGAGQCAPDAPVQCAPFACGMTACEISCAMDEQCAPGFVCTVDTGNCVPLVEERTCSEDGKYVLDTQGERIETCRGFFVCSAGACLTRCTTTLDCQRGYACHRDKRVCFEPDADNFVGETIGCACALGRSRQPSSQAVWLLLALGLLGRRALRR